MRSLPDAIVPILSPFATVFIDPTWQKAQILLAGAVLATSQRTVAAALRLMGHSDQRDCARYHEVINRAVWSSHEAARILLWLLLRHLDHRDGPLVFGIDETPEWRRGVRARARGIYRNAVRSSRHRLVKASGLRWISLMWLGHIPWAGRRWALPVLTVLAPSRGITSDRTTAKIRHRRNRLGPADGHVRLRRTPLAAPSPHCAGGGQRLRVVFHGH